MSASEKTAPTTAQQGGHSTVLTQEAVAEYLRAFPDFLTLYPELLATLQVPQTASGETENVTNFYAFQTQKLKKELARTQEKNKLLLQTSVQNMTSQQHIHELVLDALNTESAGDLLALLRQRLGEELDIDQVHLFLLPTTGLPAGVMRHSQQVEAETFEAIFSAAKGHVVLRTLYEAGDKELYAELAPAAASDALLELTAADGSRLGALALVSHQRDRFHAGQAGDLLEFLGQVLSTILRAWVVDGPATTQPRDTHTKTA